MSPQTTAQAGLTRRDILKRGAVLGGALVWVTPAVQIVGMGRAKAQIPSPGCIRYCMKWEVDGNDRVQDTEVQDDIVYVTPCDPDDTWAVLWTSNWVALGEGGNDDLDSLGLADEGTQIGESGEGGSDSGTSDLKGTAEEEEEEEEDGEEEDDDDETLGTDGGEEGGGEVDALSEGTEGSDEGTETTTARAAQTEVQPAQTNGPPGNGGIPGNCITCDGSVNDDAAIADHVQHLANTTEHGIQVYGDVNLGFYISYPPDCSLAVLAGGEPAAAAKCGGGIGPDSCNTDNVTDEDDDPCFEGNKRIFINPCASAGAISHLELIIDCCE
ncbi:MAG: hypothetical protein WD156_09295 [Acidimicrobiia bacterium]